MEPAEPDSLDAFPFFGPLTREEREDLAGRTAVVSLPAGDVLFRQGDRGLSLYLLVAGRIEVRAEDRAGAEHCLVTLEPGAILGELALMTSLARTATAVAMTDAELWELDRETCQDGTAAGRRWANLLVFAIAQGLAERLSTVSGQLTATIALLDDRELDDRDQSTDDKRTRVAELELLRRHLVAEWTF